MFFTLVEGTQQLNNDTIIAVIGTVIVTGIVNGLINKFSSSASQKDLEDQKVIIDKSLSDQKGILQKDIDEHKQELDDHKTKIWAKSNGLSEKFGDIELKLIKDVSNIALSNKEAALIISENYVKKTEINQYITLYLAEQRRVGDNG